MRGRKNLFSSSYYLPSYSLPRLFSSVLHFAPLSTINWHYAWNRLVHSGPENFFQCRCKGSIDVHLGAFDILKAHTHAATIPALALVKRHFFSIFRFAVEESFWRFVFGWCCFIVDRNELTYFLKRSLQSTFISVTVIQKNLYVYLYIITWKTNLARKKKVFYLVKIGCLRLKFNVFMPFDGMFKLIKPPLYLFKVCFRWARSSMSCRRRSLKEPTFEQFCTVYCIQTKWLFQIR